MVKVVINRTSEYSNLMRDYGIYIDRKKVGTIANGETKEFNISAGHHLIFAKIDWCTSPTLSLNINDNEAKVLNVGGFKGGSWLMPATLIILAISYFINLKFDFIYPLYFVIPVFLLLVYYLTIGRSKYLTLTENKSERQSRMALR